MTSRERIRAAWNGDPVDHVPLTTWCFGVAPPAELRWSRDDEVRDYWYSMRMEHIHTLPRSWDLGDDFRRVLAWQSLGVDDVLDVSVPWSAGPGVTSADTLAPAGAIDPEYPVLVRDYETPSGPLRHAVRRTGEEVGEGWVVQPEWVPLFEDYNIPRGVRHAVTAVSDIEIIAQLYQPPNDTACDAFREHTRRVGAFADKHGVAVQAWAGFGMDAVVWLAGVEGAVLMAVDEPRAFGRLVEIVAEADVARAELAAQDPTVDLIVARGWYSATDLWSPALFDEFVCPGIESIARVAHKSGKKMAYAMTTGVEALGPRLAEAGVDVLYFVDPVQDGVDVTRARDLLGGRMTLVGGINSVSLRSDSAAAISEQVAGAIDALAPTGRFILHPVDALFPDTPWSGIEALLQAWRIYR